MILLQVEKPELKQWKISGKNLNHFVLKAARKLIRIKEKPKSAGKTCPKCGKELIIRMSKYGTEFICCSGFPKCKYTESMTSSDPKDTIKCPDCGDGIMVERVAKKTKEVFWMFTLSKL